MNCPKCGFVTEEEDITKGSKVVGTNMFCKNLNCDWEARVSSKPLN